MSKFVRSHRFETVFDGDTVTAELAPLEYADMLVLQSSVRSDGEKREVADFVNASREVVPKYVKSFAGLTDADGQPLGIDIVASQVYFSELLNQIVTKLIEVSQPPARPT